MKNGIEPLRLSYQRGSHYNAILNPYKPAVGIGLGLAGYCLTGESPNVKHLRDAVRLSEDLAIEQTMFEDKLKTTDWEATNEAIEEQIARESYLQWCREQQAQKKQQNFNTQSNSTITSSSIAGNVNDHQKLSPKRELDKSESTFDTLDLYKRNRNLSAQQSRSKSDEEVFDDLDYEQRSDESSSSNYYYSSHSQYPQRKRRSNRRRGCTMSPLNTGNNNSNNNSSDGDCSPDLSPNKKRKFTSTTDTPGPSKNHTMNQSCNNINLVQSCSKSNVSIDNQPVSEFYKSLLESSYSDTETGKLN